jgi:hypothetical protein
VRRLLVNLLTCLSLLLAVSTCALWVRSYFVGDGVLVNLGTPLLAIDAPRLSFNSVAGTVGVFWERWPPIQFEVLRTTASAKPIGGGYLRALVMFDAGTLPWGGGHMVMFPHWTAAVFFSLLPAVRLVLRRRRRRSAARGFPVDATPPTP